MGAPGLTGCSPRLPSDERSRLILRCVYAHRRCSVTLGVSVRFQETCSCGYGFFLEPDLVVFVPPLRKQRETKGAMGVVCFLRALQPDQRFLCKGPKRMLLQWQRGTVKPNYVVVFPRKCRTTESPTSRFTPDEKSKDSPRGHVLFGAAAPGFCSRLKCDPPTLIPKSIAYRRTAFVDPSGPRGWSETPGEVVWIRGFEPLVPVEGLESTLEQLTNPDPFFGGRLRGLYPFHLCSGFLGARWPTPPQHGLQLLKANLSTC